MKELIIEFHYPKQLQDPKPKYNELVRRLTQDLSREDFDKHIAGASANWAINSGYYFFYKDANTDNHFVFIHVSLNVRDFININ